MKIDAPLPPILWTNAQGSDLSAWPALVDRGQCVLGPLTPELLPTCINALPTAERAEVIKLALGIGGLGGFEVDPRDSASLQELREVIETNLGWESGEQEEEANYPARVQEISKRWKDAERAIDAEKSIAEHALNRAVEAEALARSHEKKWRDYETSYILPCFDWATELGFDLHALVAEAKGNCVVRFFGELRDQNQKLARENNTLNERVSDALDVAREFQTKCREALEAAKEAVATLGVATQRNQALESELAAARSDAAIFRSLLEQHGIEIPEP